MGNAECLLLGAGVTGPLRRCRGPHLFPGHCRSMQCVYSSLATVGHRDLGRLDKPALPHEHFPALSPRGPVAPEERGTGLLWSQIPQTHPAIIAVPPRARRWAGPRGKLCFPSTATSSQPAFPSSIPSSSTLEISVSSKSRP